MLNREPRVMRSELPTGLALHLAGRVRAVRRRYRKRLARCQEKFSETAVHDLRIETRRVLALLDLLDALKAGGSRNKLRKAFKQRLDAFDELRDTHVQRRLLKPLWRDFPEAIRLRKILARREARLVARLARKIKTVRQLRLNRRLKRLEKALGPRAGAAARSPDVRQATAALHAAFRHVVLLRRRASPDDTETIHRLRVAFKRFRYMSELLQPVLPWLTRDRLKRMKAYQDLAGNVQDLEVLLARLALAAQEQELPPAAADRLRDELLRQRRRAILAFLDKIDSLLEFRPGPASLPAAGDIRTLPQ